MVPNVAKPGTSFKGALAYYLHDKREDGQTRCETSERVSWTETRNLATDNPELAGKIMAATAKDQDRLKAEAGVRNTGRKSDRSVYAYSLAWHPDESGQISRAEMLRAADESLLAIGGQDRQAIIVCHRDEPHPHVHVILNRVSPEDGRMLSTSQDYRKLDAWALAYRQGRGEEQKYCPARAEKVDAVRRKGEGEAVDFVRGEKSLPRSLAEEHAKAKAAGADHVDQVTAKQRQAAARLAQTGRDMNKRHGQEWKDMAAAYKAQKADIRAQTKAAIKQARSSITERYRPEWRQLFREQHRDKQRFDERETRVLGKIRNAVQAVSTARRLDPDAKGFVSRAYNYARNLEARSATLAKAHAADRRALGAQQNKELNAAVARIRAEGRDQGLRARGSYQAQRAALVERQGADKATLKAAWRRHGEDRRRAYATIRRAAQARSEAKQDHGSEKSQARTDGFRSASQGKPEAKSQAKGRSRSRSRSRTGGEGSC